MSGKDAWCRDCYSDFILGYIAIVRSTCETILGVLGIGNGLALSHLTDAADFEAETANLIKREYQA